MSAEVGTWWGCPNGQPCPHAKVLHDIDVAAGTSLCRAEGCGCAIRLAGEWVVDRQPAIDLSGSTTPTEDNQYVVLFGEWRDGNRPGGAR